MQLKLQSAFPLFFSILLIGMSTTSAHAYLDGGTGSMILQLFLGGMAGLAIAGKLYWHRFLAFFGAKTRMAERERTEGKLAEGRETDT